MRPMHGGRTELGVTARGSTDPRGVQRSGVLRTATPRSAIFPGPRRSRGIK